MNKVKKKKKTEQKENVSLEFYLIHTIFNLTAKFNSLLFINSKYCVLQELAEIEKTVGCILTWTSILYAVLLREEKKK